MKPSHTPTKGTIAAQIQEDIDAETAAGERRYWNSIMVDEISNDPEVFGEESDG